MLLSAHGARRWWRNLPDEPVVELRLGGTDRVGTASVLRGEEALDDFRAFLAEQPAVARASGVKADREGRPDREKSLEALAYTVVVSVQLDE